MLMLVGYDIHQRGDLEILSQQLFYHGDGDAVNIPNGPRFLDTRETPDDLLEALKTELPADDLLVASLGKVGSQQNLKPHCVQWLEGHGVQMNGKPVVPEQRILAIAYTVRIPKTLHKINLTKPLSQEDIAKRKKAFADANSRRREVREALEDAGASRPVNALCFLKTKKSPKQVRENLSTYLNHKTDELLVVEAASPLVY